MAEVYGGILAATEIAPQVKKLYVTGGRATEEIDSAGAAVRYIDLIVEGFFIAALRPRVSSCHSEDGGKVFIDGKGDKYIATVDALDGSTKVLTNGGGGTIIAFRKAAHPHQLRGQTGSEIVASMIATYGIETKIIIAFEGKGAHEFILKDGNFYKVRQVSLPETKLKTKEEKLRIALGGVRSKWPKGFAELVDEWIKDGAVVGYGGALVTDIFGMFDHIMEGEGRRSIFAYLANKLRLRTELQPIAFILKEAGGEGGTYSHKDNKKAKNLHGLLETRLNIEKDPSEQQKGPSAFGDKKTMAEVRVALVPSTSKFSGLRGRDLFDALESSEAGRRMIVPAFNIRTANLPYPGLIRGAKAKRSIIEFQKAKSELGYTHSNKKAIIHNIYEFANEVREECAKEGFNDFIIKGDHLTTKVDKAFLEDAAAQKAVVELFDRILATEDNTARKYMFLHALEDKGFMANENVANAMNVIKDVFDMILAEVDAGYSVFAIDASWMPMPLNSRITSFFHGMIPADRAIVEGEVGEIDGDNNSTPADAIEFLTGVRYAEEIEVSDPKTGEIRIVTSTAEIKKGEEIDDAWLKKDQAGKYIELYRGKGLIDFIKPEEFIRNIAVKNGSAHGIQYDENNKEIPTKIKPKLTKSISDTVDEFMKPYGIKVRIVQHGITGTPLKELQGTLRPSGIRSGHVGTHWQVIPWSEMVKAAKEDASVKALVLEMLVWTADLFGNKFLKEADLTKSRINELADRYLDLYGQEKTDASDLAFDKLIGKALKNANGPFREQLKALPEWLKDRINSKIQQDVEDFFDAFGSTGSADLVERHSFDMVPVVVSEQFSGLRGRDLFDALESSEAGRRMIVPAFNIRTANLPYPGLIRGAKAKRSIIEFQKAKSELGYTHSNKKAIIHNIYEFANEVREECAKEGFNDFIIKGDHLTTKVDKAFLEDAAAQKAVVELFDRILATEDNTARKYMFLHALEDKGFMANENVANAMNVIKDVFDMILAEVDAGYSVFAIDASWMPMPLNSRITSFFHGMIPADRAIVEGEVGEIDGDNNSTPADAIEFLTGVRYAEEIEVSDPKTGEIRIVTSTAEIKKGEEIDDAWLKKDQAGKYIELYRGKGLIDFIKPEEFIRNIAVKNGSAHGIQYDENNKEIPTKIKPKLTKSISDTVDEFMKPYGIKVRIVQHGITGTPLKELQGTLRPSGIRSGHVGTHWQVIPWSEMVKAAKEDASVKALVLEMLVWTADLFGNKFLKEADLTKSRINELADRYLDLYGQEKTDASDLAFDKLIGKALKNANGPFREQLKALPEWLKDRINSKIQQDAEDFFDAFGSTGSAQLVDEYLKTEEYLKTDTPIGEIRTLAAAQKMKNSAIRFQKERAALVGRSI